MKVVEETKYIAIFDSGVGGLTVLHEAMSMMPNEDYLYYADSAHVPYGHRSSYEINKLVSQAVQKIMHYPIKAIVLACNTATSISVQTLRDTYEIPVIGMEPAIKVAADMDQKGKILVLATEVTLKEKKYKDLVGALDIESQVEGIALPRLVDYAEEFIFDSDDVRSYLKEAFAHVSWEDYSNIVLGCTHFL